VFVPFGKVLGDGMDVVDRIYSGYGEEQPSGRGPKQGVLWTPAGPGYLAKARGTRTAL
jgi:hypothetical protein